LASCIADRNEGDTAYILHMAARKKIAANEDDYGSQERLVAKFLTMDHQARVTGVARAGPEVLRPLAAGLPLSVSFPSLC
jgi:hypothetical protein